MGHKNGLEPKMEDHVSIDTMPRSSPGKSAPLRIVCIITMYGGCVWRLYCPTPYVVGHWGKRASLLARLRRLKAHLAEHAPTMRRETISRGKHGAIHPPAPVNNVLRTRGSFDTLPIDDEWSGHAFDCWVDFGLQVASHDELWMPWISTAIN